MRTIFSALLLLAQIFLYFAFLLWLKPFVPILFSSGLAISAAFLVFLANTKQKNEYKLAWMLPVTIFPLFGIGLYIRLHTRTLPKKIKKQLKESDSQKKDSPLPSLLSENSQNSENADFAEISGIAQYLWRTGNFAPYTNCKVTYFKSGEDAFPILKERLESAKKFIFIESFIINSGSMWSEILSILTEKVKNGVEVRVMYDSLGSSQFSPRRQENYLRSLGIKAKAFIPLVPVFASYQNNRDHRKIVVIDGEFAFTGGTNIGDEYINRTHPLGYWKDTLVEVQGKAVNSFTNLFLELWDIVNLTKESHESYFLENPKIFDSDGIIIPYGNSAYTKSSIAENVYLHLINQAKRTLHITTPYLVLDNPITNALIFAVQRGVDVEIILPSRADHYITHAISLTFMKTLSDAGVKIYTFSPGFIHAKMFVADGETAVVGTINLDYRSLFFHFEDALFMHKVGEIQKIETDFAETRQKSARFDSDTYKKKPVFRRAVGRVFKLLAPLV